MWNARFRKYFGIDNIFFLRFNNRLSTNKYHLTKELHLNREHQPYGNALLEHYCRRWITVWLLQDLQSKQIKEDYSGMLTGIQRSRYNGSEDEYLCLTIARPAHPTPDTNISVTLGLLVNDELKRKIKFWNDPNIVSTFSPYFDLFLRTANKSFFNSIIS